MIPIQVTVLNAFASPMNFLSTLYHARSHLLCVSLSMGNDYGEQGSGNDFVSGMGGGEGRGVMGDEVTSVGGDGGRAGEGRGGGKRTRVGGSGGGGEGRGSGLESGL